MRYVLVTIVILTSIMGCTRKTDDSSQVTFSIPEKISTSNKLGTLSTSTLVHAVINVSGPGIPATIVKTWDQCHECAVPIAPPTSFEMSIPSGDNRLIQVLAVYGDDATRTYQFTYDDEVKNLVAANEAVEIQLVDIGSASGTGKLAGRYLTGTDSGPTGELVAVYTPAGKPGMEIERSAMVNGWFSIFALESSSPLQYKVGNSVIFSGKLSDFFVYGSTPSRAKLTIPAHYRWDDKNGNSVKDTGELSASGAESVVYGFFGDNALTSGKSVCADDFTGNSERHFTTIAGVSPLVYDMNDAPSATNIRLTTVGASCGSNYQIKLPVKKAFTINGGDGLAGFTAPFVHQLQGGGGGSSYYQPVVITAQAGKKDLGIKFLPGTKDQFVSVDIFRTMLAANDNDAERSIRGNNAFDCSLAMSGRFGFVLEKTHPVANISVEGVLNSTGYTNPSAGQKAIYAVCPKTTAGYIRGAAVLGYDYSMGGGSPGLVAATGFMAEIFNNVVKDICFPLKVRLISNSPGYAVHASPLDVNFVKTGTFPASVGIYTDNNCTNLWNASSNKITIPQNQNEVVAYYKGTISSGPEDSILTMNIVGQGWASYAKAMMIYSGLNATQYIRFNRDIDYVANSATDCRMIDVVWRDYMNIVGPIPSTKTFDLLVYDTNNVSKTDVKFYNSCDPAATEITQKIMTTGEYMTNVAVRTTITATRKLKIIDNADAMNFGVMYVNPTPIAGYEVSPKLKLSGVDVPPNSVVYTDTCYSMTVSMNAMNNTGLSIHGNVISAGANIYNGACSSPASSPINFNIDPGFINSTLSRYARPLSNQSLKLLVDGSTLHPFASVGVPAEYKYVFDRMGDLLTVKLLRPDNSPVTGAATQIKFSYLSPGAEACVLYSETFSLDMTGSNGLLTQQIGSGIRTDGGTHTLPEALNNGGPTLSGITSCATGNSYTSNPSDPRLLVIQFNEGGGWETLPSLEFRRAP